MSSDYFNKQWTKTLRDLEEIIRLDLEYQESRSPDTTSCDVTLKLSGVLGRYIACYNDALECQHNRLQTTGDVHAIVQAIVQRILELKEQLRKLEGSYYQYLNGGLILQKITPFDAELKDISENYQRPENINRIIRQAFEKAREKEKEDLEECNENITELISENKDDWWNESETKDEGDNKRKGINIGAIYAVEEVISEETLNRKKIVSLIQAHEKTRQITQKSTLERQKRQLWEKELQGTLNPPAPLEIRERGARIIQKVLRIYFKIKRMRKSDCKYDEIMGIKLCKKSDLEKIKDELQMFKLERLQNYNNIYAEWTTNCDRIKNIFLKQRNYNIADDFREYIREWFKIWYDEAKFFIDIPKENQGGLTMIIKDELPTPLEWLEQYEAYMEQKKANKNKTATEIKWEKMEAKREELMAKKEEMRRKKQEAALLKKIMKNPKMHPGYRYPQSKKIHHVVKAVENYKTKWLHLDNLVTKEEKEGFLKDTDINNLFAEAKKDILNTIDEDMRDELKKLKTALKNDHAANDEVMPENIKQKVKRPKKQHKAKTIDEEIISGKLADLAEKGVLVEYPKTNFEDFIGEYNYAGDDIKCNLRVVQPLGGETLSVWWERCREVNHGFKRILLVGSNASGKTLLVYAMATMNDATLYDINLLQFNEEPVERLKEFITSLLLCVRNTQPSVIYIRHVHRLYYRKAQPNEVNFNSALLKKHLIKRLIKKIHHTDRITVIGSCVDPWLTNSKQMLKHFTNVLLLPPTSYTTTQLLLQKWVLNNRIVPPSLDTHTLAQMLQGYSFRFLKNTLQEFLSADRSVRIAAYGLTCKDIFEYFLQNETETKVDYQKYYNWYEEKTHWGKIERKHLEEQIEFQNIVNKWKEKEEKKNKN